MVVKRIESDVAKPVRADAHTQAHEPPDLLLRDIAGTAQMRPGQIEERAHAVVAQAFGGKHIAGMSVIESDCQHPRLACDVLYSQLIGKQGTPAFVAKQLNLVTKRVPSHHVALTPVGLGRATGSTRNSVIHQERELAVCKPPRGLED